METIHLKAQLEKITAHVISKKEELAEQRHIDDDSDFSVKIDEILTTWREHLIEIYADSISIELDETYLRLKDWGEGVVDLLIDLNFPLDIAIEEVRFYRNTIGVIIKDDAIKHNFSIDTFYEVLSRFDSVVDKAVHWLSLSYSRSHSSTINHAEESLYELSIPIVRVTEEIGVLPLVGNIDTKRAQQLMDKALTEGTDLNLQYMIIDLSGVPIIDTMVADQIFKVISSLKLVGIETKLTGIRPEIAQTMVNIGIDFKNVFTFSSLHQAIKSLNV